MNNPYMRKKVKKRPIATVVYSKKKVLTNVTYVALFNTLTSCPPHLPPSSSVS